MLSSWHLRILLLICLIIPLVACNSPQNNQIPNASASDISPPINSLSEKAPEPDSHIQTTIKSSDLTKIENQESAVILNPIPAQSIADVIDQVEPWVVSITVESIVRGLFYDFTDEGAGSGIIVRPEGYILTNAHVIETADDIKVHLPNGKTYNAEVIGQDYVTDLAVLKINAENLPTANFSGSSDLRVGDWVLTIGNALALKGGPTVTLGIISALGRTVVTQGGSRFYDLIQTDAAINQGNSGGPLVNLNGDVIGINTAILRQAQGIGFATTSSIAKPVVDSLILNGRVIRPFIGLSAHNITPALSNELGLSVSEGLFVTMLLHNSPADRAGIKTGDVIIRIDDHSLTDIGSWFNLMWAYSAGDKVTVSYIRSNQTHETIVELSDTPQNTFGF